MVSLISQPLGTSRGTRLRLKELQEHGILSSLEFYFQLVKKKISQRLNISCLTINIEIETLDLSVGDRALESGAERG